MVELMNPGTMLREMTGIMTNPLNMFSLGQRLLTGSVRRPQQGTYADESPRTRPWGGASAAPRFADLVELDASPGRVGAVLDIVAGGAGRPGVWRADGLVDVIVLQAMSDPNRLLAVSLWESRESSDRFAAGGLGDSLGGMVAAPPRRRAYSVVVVTNPALGGSGRR
jgi:heme-degrading monooxygenase HmoA